MAEGGETGRRGALRVLVGAGGAAFCCALAAPAAVFVAGPASGGGDGSGRWIKTIKLDALREGEPKKVAIVADKRDAWTLTKNVELGAAWLVRTGGAVRALSAECPHLGCSIHAEAAGDFACPCHASAFDPAGKRLSGPSPRDMDALDTKIEDGVILVDFKTYRTGTANKVETG
jgi:menaquinol-cytochrome c reductase iron-sulfur subunit